MQKYLAMGWSIALAIAIGILAFYVLKRIFRMLQERGFMPPHLHYIFFGLARWTILIVIGLVVLGELGVSVTHLWAALSAVAALVALGFVAIWSVLSNIMCSLLLVVFAPFRIGDEIELFETAGGPSLVGKVVGINILFTSVRPAGQRGLIQIPNNFFFQKIIKRVQGSETHSLEQGLQGPQRSQTLD